MFLLGNNFYIMYVILCFYCARISAECLRKISLNFVGNLSFPKQLMIHYFKNNNKGKNKCIFFAVITSKDMSFFTIIILNISS